MYQLEDLKEGRILVFKNGTYGIITSHVPDCNLACVYSEGGWDRLETILDKDFELYESIYPLYSFMNLIKDGLDYCLKYRGLSKVEKENCTINSKQIIKIITELNEELYEDNPQLYENGTQYSYSTNGYVDLVKFCDYPVYHSENHTEEEVDDAGGLKRFLVNGRNNYIGMLTKIKAN